MVDRKPSGVLALFSAYTDLSKVTTNEELQECISDIKKLGHESILMAVLSSLMLIQIEKPVLIPLTLLASATSLILFIKRLVS